MTRPKLWRRLGSGSDSANQAQLNRGQANRAQAKAGRRPAAGRLFVVVLSGFMQNKPAAAGPDRFWIVSEHLFSVRHEQRGKNPAGTGNIQPGRTRTSLPPGSIIQEIKPDHLNKDSVRIRRDSERFRVSLFSLPWPEASGLFYRNFRSVIVFTAGRIQDSTSCLENVPAAAGPVETQQGLEPATFPLVSLT